MNLQTTETRRQTVRWVGARERISATSSPVICIVWGFPPMWAQQHVKMESAFDRHVDGLPTLDDLTAEWQARNPDFSKLVEGARDRRYREMLSEVAAGRMSRVRAERIRRRWTQDELARRAGLKQANVSRLERPSSRLSIRTAEKLAAAFDMPDYRELLPR